MDLGLKDKVVVCLSSASGFAKGIATEFAREGVFMCSPANGAISGQVICVDGAMTTAY